MRRHQYRYALVSRKGERHRSKCDLCGVERRRVAIINEGLMAIGVFDLFRAGPGKPWTTETLRCRTVSAALVPVERPSALEGNDSAEDLAGREELAGRELETGT